MARDIYRVDLAESACDFQPTATEPGLPMLDSIGANDAILYRWFGDLVAEPEWRADDRVAFYVRCSERSRLDDVECRPATKDDLAGPLKEPMEQLAASVRRARPESSNERLLHKIVQRTIDRLQSDPERADAGCFLMKYRVGKEPWRLLWCWGYQRIDARPATALICRNPDCKLLFVHRQGTRPLCPGCQSVVAKKGKRGIAAAWRSGALALCPLLLLAALLTYWLWPRQTDTPADVAAADSSSQTVVAGGDDGSGGPAAGDIFAGIADELRLAVDQIHSFDVDPAIGDDVLIASSNLSVVDVAGRRRIIGRRPGQATITLKHGQVTRDVLVQISEEPIQGIRIVAKYDEPFVPHGPIGTLHPRHAGPLGPFVPDEGHGGGVRESVRFPETGPGAVHEVPVPPGGGRVPTRPPVEVNKPDPIPPIVVPADRAGVPVRLVSWRPLEATAESFVPELHLEVSETAAYRVAGPDGVTLSDWQSAGPGTGVVITCHSGVARTADGEYELTVERRVAGKTVKRYVVPLTLKPDEV